MTEINDHLTKLRSKAIGKKWHLKKGKKGKNSQDLLSHVLDVVQITYNIVKSLDYQKKYVDQDYISVAFFHDLHKLEEIGGTG